MGFVYENCEYSSELIYGDSSCTLVLNSVKGSVLKVPSIYGKRTVVKVGISTGIFKYHERNLRYLEYLEPTPDWFPFFFVEEIHVPKSITKIQLNRMLFPNLKRVFIEPSNKNYKVVGDCLLERVGYEEWKYSRLVAYFGCEEKLIVPEEVVSLGSFAFSFSSVRTIVFPARLECASIEPFQCSKWLENFDEIVVLRGIVLALKSKVNEFVFTGKELLIENSFKFKVPEKIVIDCNDLEQLLEIDLRDFKCIELRNSELFLNSREKSFIGRSESIVVSPESKNYCSIDGVLFSKDCKELLVYPAFKESEEYSVQEGVVRISKSAFDSNVFCKTLRLPTTLQKFEFRDQYFYVDEVIFPKSCEFFRLSSLFSNFVRKLTLPASVTELSTNNIIMQKATVDATKVQSFEYEAVLCYELWLGSELRFAAKGAFCGVSVLCVPEYKSSNFIESLIPNKEKFKYDIINYVVVTRDDGSVLTLVVPILYEKNNYLKDLCRFWDINGIDLSVYVEALLEIDDFDVRCDSLHYFILNNLDYCKGFSDSIVDDLIRLLLYFNEFEVVLSWCSEGIVSPVVARQYLKEDLPSNLIPYFMSVLQDSEFNDCDLSI